jgi:putative nucleotidyltransferase with HDIG domain
MTLEPWAKAQAERLIAPLGDRWTHVQAVADKAHGLAAVLSAEDADLLVAAALLHDVGYAPSLNRLGFHAVDGARFLRGLGQERLARLVAHHSGARFEAEERDLVEELAPFPVEDGPVMIRCTEPLFVLAPTSRRRSIEPGGVSTASLLSRCRGRCAAPGSD